MLEVWKKLGSVINLSIFSDFEMASRLTVGGLGVANQLYLWGLLLSVAMFVAVFFWEKTKADKSDTEHVRKIMVSLGYAVFWQFLILLIVFFLIFIAFGANNTAPFTVWDWFFFAGVGSILMLQSRFIGG